MLPPSSLQLVEVTQIRLTQSTVSESFGHGKPIQLYELSPVTSSGGLILHVLMLWQPSLMKLIVLDDKVPITSSYVWSGICFKCSRLGERAQQFFNWNSWRG